jgi:hypothetical protein
VDSPLNLECVPSLELSPDKADEQLDFDSVVDTVALQHSDFCPSTEGAYVKLHAEALNLAVRAAYSSKEPEETLRRALLTEFYALHFYADEFAPGHRIGRATAMRLDSWDTRTSREARKYWNERGLILVSPCAQKPDCAKRFNDVAAIIAQADPSMVSPGEPKDSWRALGDKQLDVDANSENRVRLMVGVEASLTEVLDSFIEGKTAKLVAADIAPPCLGDNDRSLDLADQAGYPANRIPLFVAFSGGAGIMTTYSLAYIHAFAPFEFGSFELGVQAGKATDKWRPVARADSWFFSPVASLSFGRRHDSLYARVAPVLVGFTSIRPADAFRGLSFDLGKEDGFLSPRGGGLQLALSLHGDLRWDPLTRQLVPGVGMSILEAVLF